MTPSTRIRDQQQWCAAGTSNLDRWPKVVARFRVMRRCLAAIKPHPERDAPSDFYVVVCGGAWNWRRSAALAGDTAVGALIVRGDEVVAEGIERTRATLDPSAHAEVEAIRQACQHLETLDLRGCSLYSTVEPCVLCGYAIRRTGIAHVVHGVPAGQAGACTSSYAILADRDLEGWPQVPSVTGDVQ